MSTVHVELTAEEIRLSVAILDQVQVTGLPVMQVCLSLAAKMRQALAQLDQAAIEVRKT